MRCDKQLNGLIQHAIVGRCRIFCGCLIRCSLCWMLLLMRCWWCSVGRVIRSKMDYGLMVFADQRFNRADKRSKLPAWIIQYLDKTHMNLSTDRALTVAKDFLKRMAQPRSHKEELGTTMLDEQTVTRMTNEVKRMREIRMGEEEEEKQGGGAGFMPTAGNAGIPRAAPTPWTEADRRAASAANSATSSTSATAASAVTVPANAAAAASPASAAMELE